MGKKSKRRGGTGGGRKSRPTAGAGDAGTGGSSGPAPVLTPSDVQRVVVLKVGHFQFVCGGGGGGVVPLSIALIYLK